MAVSDPAGASGAVSGLGAEFGDIPDPAAGVASRPAPEAAAPAEASPTRPERNRRLVAGLGIALAWAALITIGFGLRPDIGRAGILAELALWAVTAAVALVGALHPGQSGISVGVRVLAVLLAGVPAVFLACAAAWSSDAPPIPLTWATSKGCLLLSTAIGLGPLGVALFCFRGAFAAAAPWRLSLLGAVCGLTGSIGCQAHCAIGDAFTHVGVAHGMPILLGAVVGGVYGALRGRA